MVFGKLALSLLSGAPLLVNAGGHGEKMPPAPIYAFWDDVNKQHTFHAGECHKIGDTGTYEVRGALVFQADLKQVENSEPVYQWWDNVNKQHTFHFKPAWKHGYTDETTRDPEDIVFYAFDETHKTDDMCKVHAFWDDVNKQHTFHCGEPWKHGDKEEMKEDDKQGLYWTYKKDYRPDVDHPEPVYSWWDDVHKQHNFHMEPAWPIKDNTCKMDMLVNKESDKTKDIAFFAWGKQEEGTEPVYAFWDENNKQHTFHRGEPWTDGHKEVKESDIAVFFAYPESRTVDGVELCEVKVFWDKANMQHTFHCGEPWNADEEVDPNNKPGMYWAFSKTWTPAEKPDGARDQGVVDDDEEPPTTTANMTNSTEASGSHIPSAVQGASWVSFVLAGLFW